MITISKTKNIKIDLEDRYILVEMEGLSTDEKPTEYENEGKKSYIDNGSTFIEMDSSKIYFYDLENKQWKEF